MKFGSYLQKNWDWRAAGNFMFGGTGSGLLAVTAGASLPAVPPWPLAVVALAFVGAGLSLVWLELGRPWRFINVFFHPQASWMTREAVFAMLLFPLALLGIFAAIPFVIALAGLIGLAFLYCQSRMLHATKGIPAWRDDAMIGLNMSTGLTEGAGLFFVITSVIGTPPGSVPYLFLAFVGARWYAWLRYRSRLAKARAPQPALDALNRISPLMIWGGSVLPAVLVLLVLVLAQAVFIQSVVAGALAVLTGWLMKYTIMRKAAYVQGYGVAPTKRGRPANPRPPVRRQGNPFQV